MSGNFLSERQVKAILEDYKPGVYGSGSKATADKHNVHRNTVLGVVDRAKKRKGNLQALTRGFKRRKLSDKEEKKVCSALDEEPLLTNRALATLVENKITPRTITNILKRAKTPFTTKNIEDVNNVELTREWKNKVQKLLNDLNRSFPIKNRIYADETFIYANEAKKAGRSRRGKRIFRRRNYYSKKFTLHVYMNNEKVIAWDLASVNANDTEVKRVFTRKVVKHVQKGNVLIWDQLGRAGRCKNPLKQHFNPHIRQMLRTKGASMLLLPPKGKYLNPVELLFNHLKQHAIRPYKRRAENEFSLQNLRRILKKYFEELEKRTISSFFTCRANGSFLRKNNMLD